jgi:acetyl esterase/lipase
MPLAKPFIMQLNRTIFLLLVILNISCKAQQVITLYTGTAPGSLAVEDKESSAKSTAGNGRFFVTNVTIPTLTVYLPKKRNASGATVIICPGGGYNRLSIDDGGYEAGKAFAEVGITAVVLKYRTWREDAYTDYKNVPLLDLQQAMNIVYSNAKKWNIDTSHIGILGFSAGGHLTAMAATTFKTRAPAFTLLIYPIISFLDSLTSKTSATRSTLLGKDITAEQKVKFSPELHITSTTAPAFIVHAEDDKTSLVGNSIVYYKGLVANKIPAELVLYKKGGHGFALYNKAEDKYWMPDAINWMAQNGFYKK